LVGWQREESKGLQDVLLLREEKIVRQTIQGLKRWRERMVPNAQQAGVLQWKKPSLFDRKDPEGPRSPSCKRGDGERPRGEKKKGRCFLLRLRGRESLRGGKPQESEHLRPELIPQGAKKESGYREGRKSSERQIKAGKVFMRSARTKGEKGNLFFDPSVERSFEGEIPRALGAERGFLGV
jgi:hypothetical protein